MLTFFGESDEMLYAETDVADLVVKDSFEDPSAPQVAARAYPLQHRRGDVEPARFQDHRHDRQAARDIVPRRMCRIPQPAMRGQGAVMASH